MASLAPPFVPQMASGAASTSRQPPLLKRSSSAISLPSPPSDMDVDAHTDVEDDDEDIKAFAELETGPCRPQAYLDLEDEEEIDELDSDQDVDVTAERPSLRLVGNLETSQNPFLTTARAQTEAHTRAERSTRPDHPQASPTHLTQRQRQRRQRNVVDKIHCAPKLGHDSLSAKGTLRSPPKAMGADDLSNPFIDRPWEVTANTADAGSDSDSDREDGGRRRRSAPSEERKVWRKGQAQRPDKVTYVFRGKRITYDVPLSALLAPEDPTDCTSPFAEPSPRLLFPPKSQAPITPPNYRQVAGSGATTSSSFLDALRATAATGLKQGDDSMLPPTPVTERQPAKKSSHAQQLQAQKRGRARGEREFEAEVEDGNEPAWKRMRRGMSSIEEA